jgi:hypothetical protein
VQQKALQYEKDVGYAQQVLSQRPNFQAPSDNNVWSRKNNDNRPKTQLELLAEQRDYKRRRMKYRAKNVHITKRTPTQVARAVIGMKMDEIYSVLGIPNPDQYVFCYFDTAIEIASHFFFPF